MKDEIANIRKAPAASTRLADFDLSMPSPVFRAAAFQRSAADIYQGVKIYSREDLTALIEQNLGSLDGIEPEKLGFWRAVISNSSLDTYFTRMAENSLRNYANDASNPTVAFQNSHRHNELPVGRSIVGQFIESGNVPQGESAEDYFPAVVADFYSHRDLQLGQVSVEQFLLGIQTHVVRDVSIGFKEGVGFQYTCSICGNDYFDWDSDCRHIAGVEYDIKPSDGDPTNAGNNAETKRLCFVWIQNARLSEVSAVYDGATTNAMIIKAEREARAGRLDSGTEQYLERRFRFRSQSKEIFSGLGDGKKARQTDTTGGDKPDSTNNREETNNMSEENKTAQIADLTPQIQAFGRSLGFEIADDATPESVFATVRADFNSNKTAAAKFEEVRKEEIEFALAEEIRCVGDVAKFGEAEQTAYRASLENASLETIRNFKSKSTELANLRFGKGRQSADNPEGDLSDEGENVDAAKDKTRSTDKDEMPALFRRVPAHKMSGGV